MTKVWSNIIWIPIWTTRYKFELFYGGCVIDKRGYIALLLPALSRRKCQNHLRYRGHEEALHPFSVHQTKLTTVNVSDVDPSQEESLVEARQQGTMHTPGVSSRRVARNV